MTTEALDTPTPPRPKQILGIGDIVAKTLAIFFQRLPVVILLTLPAAASIFGILYLALSEFEREIVGMLGLSGRMGDTMLGFLTFSTALGTGAALASGPLAGVAQAFIRGTRTPVRACFLAMFRKTVLVILVGILIAAGVMFLMFMNALLPGAYVGFLSLLMSLTGGMYLLARWGLALPTISQERIGFTALKRSDWLSAEYRWQGTGTLVLSFVISVIFGGVFVAGTALAGGYLVYEVMGISIPNKLQEVLLFLDFGLGLSITIAILTLSIVVLRLRLIEIKEPPDIEDMITVFE
ncbi:MAG: hypothetical protein AAFV19_06315 [Pseudomonadota bacterium]